MVVIHTIRINKDLCYSRQLIECYLATDSGIDRDIAPAIDRQSLGRQGRFHRLARDALTLDVLTEKHHTDGIVFAQLDTQSGERLATHKRVRHLHEQAAPVSGSTICSDTPAVGHARQGFDGRLQQAMARLALHMGDQSKSAVIPELLGAVETARGRRLLWRGARFSMMTHNPFR